MKLNKQELNSLIKVGQHWKHRIRGSIVTVVASQGHQWIVRRASGVTHKSSPKDILRHYTLIK